MLNYWVVQQHSLIRVFDTEPECTITYANNSYVNKIYCELPKNLYGGNKGNEIILPLEVLDALKNMATVYLFDEPQLKWIKVS